MLGVKNKDNRMTAGGLLLLLLLKEDQAVFAALFGISLLFDRERRKTGAAITVVSAIVFIFVSRFFLPQESGEQRRRFLLSLLGGRLPGRTDSEHRPGQSSGRLAERLGDACGRSSERGTFSAAAPGACTHCSVSNFHHASLEYTSILPRSGRLLHVYISAVPALWNFRWNKHSAQAHRTILHTRKVGRVLCMHSIRIRSIPGARAQERPRPVHARPRTGDCPARISPAQP